MTQKNQFIVPLVNISKNGSQVIIGAKLETVALIHGFLNPVKFMKRAKGAKIEPMRKGKSREKEYYSIPIGLIPEWLLKAETGKGIWEYLVPDAEYRESLLAKIKERLQREKEELYYEKNI